MQVEEFISLLEGVKGNGNQYTAKCPAHDDHRQSLSVSTGNDGRILVKCQAGCNVQAVVRALNIKVADLFPDRQNKTASQRKVIAEYIYTDVDGKPVHKKIRYEPKHF